MGKSTLLRRAAQLASARDVRLLEGAADSIEVSTAYLALRSIIAALLEIPTAAPDEARAAVLRRLERLPARLRDLAPLLNIVLPLDFADNELTAQMSGTIRAANLTDLLLGLVEQIAADGPVMFALEDLHWMDDASLQFCARVLDALPGVLLVATLRPMSPEPPALARLGRGDGREKLALDTLAPDEIVELVRRRLGARTIPVAVKDLIVAKAEGNPFYSEEIAIALREGGVIVIEDGECQIAVTQELSTLNLPGTVKGVITSRVDRLAPTPQVALKVASVLGRSFRSADAAGRPAGDDRRGFPPEEPRRIAGRRIARAGVGRSFAFRIPARADSRDNVQPASVRAAPAAPRRSRGTRGARLRGRPHAVQRASGLPLVARRAPREGGALPGRRRPAGAGGPRKPVGSGALRRGDQARPDASWPAVGGPQARQLAPATRRRLLLAHPVGPGARALRTGDPALGLPRSAVWRGDTGRSTPACGEPVCAAPRLRRPGAPSGTPARGWH